MAGLDADCQQLDRESLHDAALCGNRISIPTLLLSVGSFYEVFSDACTVSRATGTSSNQYQGEKEIKGGYNQGFPTMHRPIQQLVGGENLYVLAAIR